MNQINRRDVLKAAIAAVLIPVVPTSANTITPAVPVLTEFVGESWTLRYKFDVPFVQRGFLCATDSRVLLRVPTALPEFATPEGKTRPFPPVMKCWDEYASVVGKWRPWPEQRWLIDPSETCSKLEGLDCVTCDGGGCADCFGTGYQSPAKTCRVCRGTEYWMAQRVGGRTVQARYDLKLRSFLPGPLEFLEDGLGDGANPIRFRFRGGDGLLMPFEDGRGFREMTGVEKGRLRVV